METLTRRDAFVRATKQGRHVITKGIILQAVANETSVTGIGFTASSRLGGAIQRNRIKRRLRALVREQAKEDVKHAGRRLFQSGYDYVLVGRPATLLREYPQLRGDLRYALHQLQKPEKAENT